MAVKEKPSLITLLLLISFAAVNALLFTPALPDIAHFFSISEAIAQHTITWFLVGYATGQLLYGPIANRFGRKPAIYIGIILQIFSSIICILAGELHQFWLLVLGRFLLALGSGVGLNIVFTLINETHAPKEASQKTSYVVLAFAVAPGLAVALGGVLTTYYGWESCFYAGMLYGVLLLFFCIRLPETHEHLDRYALKLKILRAEYSRQFKNINLVVGGLLIGGGTSLIYAFAGAAPFIAIEIIGMRSDEYGFANIIPSLGLFIGSFFSANAAKRHSFKNLIRVGLIVVAIGILLMLFFIASELPPLATLFLPVFVIYFGLAFIYANASTMAMSQVSDKAHGSAVMSFLNMSFATVVVLVMGFFPIHLLLLPILFSILCLIMFGLYQWIRIEIK